MYLSRCMPSNRRWETKRCHRQSRCASARRWHSMCVTRRQKVPWIAPAIDEEA
eukprot:31006_5